LKGTGLSSSTRKRGRGGEKKGSSCGRVREREGVTCKTELVLSLSQQVSPHERFKSLQQQKLEIGGGIEIPFDDKRQKKRPEKQKQDKKRQLCSSTGRKKGMLPPRKPFGYGGRTPTILARRRCTDGGDRLRSEKERRTQQAIKKRGPKMTTN